MGVFILCRIVVFRNPSLRCVPASAHVSLSSVCRGVFTLFCSHCFLAVFSVLNEDGKRKEYLIGFPRVAHPTFFLEKPRCFVDRKGESGQLDVVRLVTSEYFRPAK